MTLYAPILPFAFVSCREVTVIFGPVAIITVCPCTFHSSDLVVTVTKTITKSNCASFTQTITKTESKSNTKTILKLSQNPEHYIKTVTKTMLKLKRFSMVKMFTRLECTTLH